MWTCENCGYTDEVGDAFEEELDDDGDVLRYCPECGSDEVLQSDVDEEDDEDDDLFPDKIEGVKWRKGGGDGDDD